jgi:hypothetical protein
MDRSHRLKTASHLCAFRLAEISRYAPSVMRDVLELWPHVIRALLMPDRALWTESIGQTTRDLEVPTRESLSVRERCSHGAGDIRISCAIVRFLSGIQVRLLGDSERAIQ